MAIDDAGYQAAEKAHAEVSATKVLRPVESAWDAKPELGATEFVGYNSYAEVSMPLIEVDGKSVSAAEADQGALCFAAESFLRRVAVRSQILASFKVMALRSRSRRKRMRTFHP